MRRAITFSLIVAGTALMAVSYFVLAAPWGSSATENSNPRVPFAAAVFVAGVVLVFVAAVVYEILPERRHR